MPKTLILNQSNIVAGSGNSVFQYSFPLGGIQFKEDLISVLQISLYNSVFNISASNNNNRFSYIWVDGTVVNITLPDSYLELAEINEYLQSVMIANKHYLTAGTQNIYLMEIVVNPSRYADQLNCYLISQTIATTNSWTLPVGATWVLPTNPILPYFVVPPTNFQKLIGYQAGQYPQGVITGAQPAQIQTPAFTGTQSFLSTSAPEIVPQPTYLCQCSLVNNRYSIPNQLIYSLSPQGVAFGELYVNQVNNASAFSKIENGTYPSFTFRFTDTAGNPIVFQDPNTLILLVIKSKEEIL